ncbi:hypothetical protein J437_LFUL015012 [Ladona fulva]|uniref:CIDE-N domain-containing protein n=1 Tax=Ladona fulva TaxID=123851 RepID=A0A8K0KFY3_LADFU|nr:hypothetical protein J437_LFUL015012 [Ladona fulva]
MDEESSNLDDTTPECLPYKVVDYRREKKKGIVASSLQELKFRGREKLGLDNDATVTVVLEQDGTEVDDEDYFATLERNTSLMLLSGQQRWLPPGKMPSLWQHLNIIPVNVVIVFLDAGAKLRELKSFTTVFTLRFYKLFYLLLSISIISQGLVLGCDLGNSGLRDQLSSPEQPEADLFVVLRALTDAVSRTFPLTRYQPVSPAERLKTFVAEHLPRSFYDIVYN